MRRIIVAITGASGAIYGVRALQLLKEMADVESHVIVTSSAHRTIAHETPYKPDDIRVLADRIYHPRDIGAAVSSGSFVTAGMLVAPCSVKTLSGIANSYNENLVVRAADVCLKERRRVVLMLRETPLHAGHIELMAQATRNGAIIVPPVPAFYALPATLDDYAAAVGHALRDRVSELPVMDRFLTHMSLRAPWPAQQWFRMMRFAAHVTPTRYGRLAARTLGPADGAVIRDDGFEAFAKMSREATRQLPGAVEEYRAWVRPWGFAPEDLTVPVDVWAGTNDELIDASWPPRLAKRIPRATLNIRDGGHFMAHLHYREIFEALRSQ